MLRDNIRRACILFEIEKTEKNENAYIFLGINNFINFKNIVFVIKKSYILGIYFNYPIISSI